MQRQQRGAEAGLGLLRHAHRHAQDALADGGPGWVSRSAADADDLAQGRCSKVAERLIGQSFDRGNALQQALEKLHVVGGPRGHARRQLRVGNGEALAGLGQRVVVETGRPCGIKLRRQRGHPLGAEMRQQRAAAGVGGAAHQPAVAKAVRVDALPRREDRLVRQQLQHQRGAERGDCIAGRRGAGRDERSDAVGRAGTDDRGLRQAERRGDRGIDWADGGAWHEHLGEQGMRGTCSASSHAGQERVTGS